jgi:hypothetical protein
MFVSEVSFVINTDFPSEHVGSRTRMTNHTIIQLSTVAIKLSSVVKWVLHNETSQMQLRTKKVPFLSNQ